MGRHGGEDRGHREGRGTLNGRGRPIFPSHPRWSDQGRLPPAGDRGRVHHNAARHQGRHQVQTLRDRHIVLAGHGARRAFGAGGPESRRGLHNLGAGQPASGPPFKASLHPEGISMAWCRTPFRLPLQARPALTVSACRLADNLLPLEELAQGASRDTRERGCGCGGRSWPGSSRKTVALP